MAEIDMQARTAIASAIDEVLAERGLMLVRKSDVHAHNAELLQLRAALTAAAAVRAPNARAAALEQALRELIPLVVNPGDAMPFVRGELPELDRAVDLLAASPPPPSPSEQKP